MKKLLSFLCWHSATAAEGVGDYLGLGGIIALAVVVAFDYFALEFLSGIAFYVALGSAVALNVLTILELIAWIYSKRARGIREQEAEKEAQSLRTEITRLHTRTARRQITEEGKEALGKVLAKYPKQSLWITAEYNDDEAWPFANQISKVFQQYGWSGVIVRNILEDGAIRAFPGVGITAEPMQGNPDWAVQIIRDIAGVFEADGIKMAKNWSRLLPLPAGREPAIEIHVGKRPSEVESLRREIAERQADRSITPAQKGVFKSRLSKFAPQRFQIIQLGFRQEPFLFANQIREALSECGWVGQVFSGFPAADQPPKSATA